MSTNPVPEGSIVITPSEVYNEVRSLTTAVRELVAADAADAEARADLRRRVDGLEGRMTAVEKKLLLFTGAAAAAGAGVGTWLPRLLGQ